MTLKEAKKLLKEEGFSLKGHGKPGAVSEAFTEYESPDICEAMQIVCSAGYMIMMFGNVFEARKARLKKEYEKNTKSPGSAENRIKEDSGVNPALKESASQFNDALLDEQAKKIVELTDENKRLKDQVAVIYACKENNEKYNLKQIKRLGKEIAKLNGIIHEKNEELERKTKGCCELVAESVDLKEVLRKTESLLNDTREANSKNLDTCFKNEDIIDDLKKNLSERTKLAKKYAKELSDSSLELCKLEKQLKDKDAVLSGVAEELRLSKIREKNLTEVGQKYMKENEELKKELADKVVDKIDAQALKSAESALAYKDKVIAEKDDVIADLTHELKVKHKKYVWYKGAYDAAQQILNTIADYAVKHPDKKFSDQMVGDCADSVKPEAKREKLSSEKITEIEKKVSDLFKQRDKEIADFMFVKSELLGGSDIFDQMKAQAFCEARHALLNSNFLIK